MKSKTLTLDLVLAAARTYCDTRCAQYPVQYHAGSPPRFYSTDLMSVLLDAGKLDHSDVYDAKGRAKTMTVLREACADLRTKDYLTKVGDYRGRMEYTVTTDAMRATRNEVTLAAARAEVLATLLGGEAQHYKTGSHLTLTMEAAEALVKLLGLSEAA